MNDFNIVKTLHGLSLKRLGGLALMLLFVCLMGCRPQESSSENSGSESGASDGTPSTEKIPDAHDFEAAMDSELAAQERERAAIWAAGFKEPKNVKWKTLQEAEYSMSYPSTWEFSETQSEAEGFMLMSPVESSKDEFQENINLGMEDLPPNIGLDEYRDAALEQLKTIFSDAEILENRRVRNAGGDFHEVIYVTDYLTSRLQYIQCFWIKNAKAYILTFASEESRFSKYKDIALKMMDSFVLK